jgi:aspartyl/asparaginyl-tRNA synthetase
MVKGAGIYMEDYMKNIGDSLYNFQSALHEDGTKLEDFLKQTYCDKWKSETLYHATAIRTTLVNAFTQFLVKKGLLNLEKVMLSIITDPLAHDIEHTPAIKYKGYTYVTTHSMIYSKFMACSNPHLKGIFVDSPNIRLELEHPYNVQRGKYLVDFSQIDVEVRRNRGITLDDYYGSPDKVKKVLEEDMEIIMSLFEGMIVSMAEEVNKQNADNMKALGIAIEVPKTPFPRFLKDESEKKYGSRAFEEKLGEETDSQFFWITGLYRENYDLVYPYLSKDGTKRDIPSIPSTEIFNYDILAKGIDASTGKHLPAKEILSGAIREWLYEPIIERIIDNKVLSTYPVFKNGEVENLDELGGYGPFLYFTWLKDENGKQYFPDTMGGGIGIERTLFALLRSEKIKKIDDITFFGKNPDSHPVYLF